MIRVISLLFAMYRPAYITRLVTAYKQGGYSLGVYSKWYWRTSDFRLARAKAPSFSRRDALLSWLLWLAAGVILVVGVLLTLLYHQQDALVVGVWLGLAIVLALPVLIALILPLMDMLARFILALCRPKQLGHDLICAVLEAQVRRLRQRYTFTVVAVAGSMGKTSTKLAIARLLATSQRVRHQEGNYNARLTVPLVFFDQPLPGLFNIVAWIKVFLANERTIRKGYPYDVVVVELGTDGPGQLAQFAYLQPELAVLTAVAPEHMEYFGTLDAVAAEEFAVATYAKKLLVNSDDTPERYREKHTYTAYGLLDRTDGYFAEGGAEDLTGQEVVIRKDGKKIAAARVQFLGAQGRKIVLAAAAAADMLGVKHSDIAESIAKLVPFAGRMQVLHGIKKSVLIDDTYNASPAAVEAALSVLVRANVPQRIAVLGSMNELGDFSAEAHRTVGASLDPANIDLVVTIGAPARDYVAPIAAENGCAVAITMSPYDAGNIVKKRLKPGAAVLFKGSQNGVFAEEAIKAVLADPADAKKLVRQSAHWMRVKRKQFKLP